MYYCVENIKLLWKEGLFLLRILRSRRKNKKPLHRQEVLSNGVEKQILNDGDLMGKVHL